MEDKSQKDKKVKYAPERDMALALSEYAPGKFVTINKEIYRSGRIYKNPIPKGCEDKNQAEHYFKSKDYYTDVYVCTECNWFGSELKDFHDGVCPYCKAKVDHKKMLKPWGFASAKGESVSHQDENEEFTYTEAPYYSYVPSDSDCLKQFKESKIRYTELSDKTVLTVNMGKFKNGFNVCQKCGVTEIANNQRKGKNKNSKLCCNHENNVANVYLGYKFMTDMFMIDIAYDSQKLVGVRNTEEKSILKAAVTTLHEAIKKATSLEMEIDYNEINGGWCKRISDNGDLHIEMFFYDNLTSGAGYTSMIGTMLDKVFSKARSILTECKCSRSCKNCLDNFYNQRDHLLFDRNLGLQLLDFAELGKYPDEYSESEQKAYLLPLRRLISESDDINNKEIPKFKVIPALLKKPDNQSNCMYFNPYDLLDGLPNSFVKFKEIIK